MFASGMKDILGEEMVKDRDKLEQRIKDLQENLSKVKSTRHDTTAPSTLRDDYGRATQNGMAIKMKKISKLRLTQLRRP